MCRYLSQIHLKVLKILVIIVDGGIIVHRFILVFKVLQHFQYDFSIAHFRYGVNKVHHYRVGIVDLQFILYIITGKSLNLFLEQILLTFFMTTAKKEYQETENKGQTFHMPLDFLENKTYFFQIGIEISGQ